MKKSGNCGLNPRHYLSALSQSVATNTSVQCVNLSAFETGVINVEAETELDSARQQIPKLLREHPCLPYEPGEDWKFLDCTFHSNLF